MRWNPGSTSAVEVVDPDGTRYHPDPKGWGRKRYVVGCPTCERELAAGNDFFPSHKASARCQSGGHPHCSCGTCF